MIENVKGKRVYGRWAGNETGYEERPQDCIAEVYDRFAWGGRQCFRRRQYGPGGLYCLQHAKEIEARDRK